MFENVLNKGIWQGRVDPEPNSERLHQVIQPFTANVQQGTVLVGFCCDEGVRRNHGRIGAKDAPDAIRKALANLAWHSKKPIYDGGNVNCDDENLEYSQNKLAHKLAVILQSGKLPIVLGGGHEVAFASWCGLIKHLAITNNSANYDLSVINSAQSFSEFFKPQLTPNIGIINFDAHFDLRSPQFVHSSGTPFAQIAEQSSKLNLPFNYAALGISEISNTQNLFEYAQKLNTWIVKDTDFNYLQNPKIAEKLTNWIADKTHIYLSFDIDVLPSFEAPGCSAPASLGVRLEYIYQCLQSSNKVANWY